MLYRAHLSGYVQNKYEYKPVIIPNKYPVMDYFSCNILRFSGSVLQTV